MSVSAELRHLIDAAAVFWAGEAEVFRRYWRWEKRSRETDRHWLACQCSKEIWGSGLVSLEKGLFLGPAEALVAAFPKIDLEIDRHAVLEVAEGLRAEFAHYCAFADVYDTLAQPGEPKMNPERVRIAWPEDRALSALRLEHKQLHPELGSRATRFTEGGYCTLFSEGMKLETEVAGPHGRANALIAAACAAVYEDEFGHMLKGIIGLDEEGLSAADWRLLERLSIEQLKARILMRNAQFGYPLDKAQLDRAASGGCPPIAFDYDKARLAA